MNVPPATAWHRLRAWARLRRGSVAESVIVWMVVRPGDDGAAWGEAAPAAEPLREDALNLAEDLAATKPAFVVFVGPAPTHWQDLFDVAEVFRIAGAALVLITPTHVINAQSAPIHAYHFTRIRVRLPETPSDDDWRRLGLLAGLWPRGAVDALVPIVTNAETRRRIRDLGVARIDPWPPATKRRTRIVHADLRVMSDETPWVGELA